MAEEADLESCNRRMQSDGAFEGPHVPARMQNTIYCGIIFKMPLHWILESKIQLVTVVAEGDVTRSDVEAYIAMSSGANAIEWRKLFDARKGRAIFTDEDVNTLGARIREGAAVRVVGPLAFVMPEIETPQLKRFLGFLAAAKRPMRLFQEIGPARRWIMKAK